MLLDLMLPRTDGIELMRRVPELDELPVIFISAYGRDETIARALESGAADYIVKPFSPTELVARVQAALRDRAEPESFALGELTIDNGPRRVSLGGQVIPLTATEFDLLRVLSLRAGNVVTTAVLLRRVWGQRSAGNAGRVRSAVKRLRRKLEDDAPRLREPHVRRLVNAARASHNASTRRNYHAAWRRFQAWADREGLGTMPAAPETVAAYLAERAANGLSPASLRMDRAAIRYHHTEAGHTNPADNEGVRRVLPGLTRQAACEGRTPRQAAALTEEGLAAIRAIAHLRRTGPRGRTERASTARLRGQVDIALVSVMRDAMLRRSEAVALTWADVEFRSDGSARATVRRSKSDQDGTGATLYVGRAAAVELQAIHRPDASPKARVFGFRSGRAVSNRIARAAKAAGLIGGFSGHSPRIGMARDLVASGAGIAALQVAGRWASAQMPAH